MKLFENKVGRPSNEILKKRKIFIISVTIAIITMVLAGVFVLNHFNVINLKGAVATITVSSSPKAGDKVTLDNTPIYSSAYSSKSSGKKSGTYYLYDNRVIKNKMRIVKNKKDVGKILKVVGWIKVKKTPTTTTKVASSTSCEYPYSKSNCANTNNQVVKSAQEMLKELKLYSSTVNGKFNSDTELAVKAFQKQYKITQNGKLDTITLQTLSLKTNTRYYRVLYDRAGSTTALKDAELLNGNYFKIYVYGKSDKISSTKLSKSGYEHVGYTLSSSYNPILKSDVSPTNYKYGCLKSNCSSGAKWYSESQLKGKAFYPMVYNIGQTVSKLGYLGTGQTVKLTAVYCATGKKYDKTKSACVSASTTTKKETTTTKVASSGKDGITTVVSQEFINNLSKVDLSSYYGGSKWIQTNYTGYKVGTGYTEDSSAIKYDTKNKWYTYNGSIVVATATTNLGKRGETKKIYYFTYKTNNTLYLKIGSKWYKAIVLDSCGACTNVTRYGQSSQVVDIWTKKGSGFKDFGKIQVVIPK